ncbi:MAG: hypothetical protein R3C28_15345 [Pirellulaceae bacterium]
MQIRLYLGCLLILANVGLLAIADEPVVMMAPKNPIPVDIVAANESAAVSLDSPLRSIEFTKFDSLEPMHPADASLRRISPPGTIKTYSWEPSGATHGRLFFEDVALERHGLTNYPCLQPGISALRFGKDAVLFPWRAIRPGQRLHSELGHARPGTALD